MEGDAAAQPYRIRPLRRADRPHVRRICLATAWCGSPAPDRIVDEDIWADYWTAWFTDRDRGSSWVVACPGGRVVGYLTGTADARRAERHVAGLLPRWVALAVGRRLLRREEPRRAMLGLLRSAARGEMSVPPEVPKSYPGTFHLDLLPEARRHGLGSRLLARFMARMRSLGVAGIHVQTLSVNAAVGRFCRRAGFRLAAARPLGAYAHLDPAPLLVHTWTLRTGGGRPLPGAAKARKQGDFPDFSS